MTFFQLFESLQDNPAQSEPARDVSYESAMFINPALAREHGFLQAPKRQQVKLVLLHGGLS